MSATNHRVPRVVFHGTKDAWGIRIENPKALSDLLGADALAALYKCFIGVDRIVTFEHLIYMSQVEHASKNGGRGTASAERNMHVLFLLLAGTMYELGAALQNLAHAKCALKVKDRSVWDPINHLRKAWHNDPMAARIRNGYSHHLGDIDTFKRGIASSPDVVALVRGETERQIGSRFLEPWDALLRGDGISHDAFDAFVGKTLKSHRDLPERVVALFHALLSANNISVVDERRAAPKKKVGRVHRRKT